MNTRYLKAVLLAFLLFCIAALASAQDTPQKSNLLTTDTPAAIPSVVTVGDTIINADGDTIVSFRYLPVVISKSAGGEIMNDGVACDSGADGQFPISSVQTQTSFAGKYVGSIPFSACVSPTGARVYNVPVMTAADCRLVPNVSISYNSQSGNGVAGYGWTLAAGSAITMTGKSLFYDNSISAVDISRQGDCAFLLDGVRLVRKDITMNGYQYETASGFVLASAHEQGGNVSYFSVAYPNGNTAVFGFKDNKDLQFAYPMTELADAQGFKVFFEYVKSGNNYYPVKIAYGGKSRSACTAEIEFTYTERTDFAVAYISGVPFSSDILLKTVVSRSLAGGVMQELRTYSLVHEFDRVNRLVSIGCSSCGSQLPPLTFSYGSPDVLAPARIEVGGSHFMGNYFTAKDGVKPVFLRGKFHAGSYEDGMVSYPGCFSNYAKVAERVINVGNVTVRYPKFGSGYPDNQKLLVASTVSSFTPVDSIVAGKEFQTMQAVDVDADGIDELVKVNTESVSGSTTTLRITKYSVEKGYASQSFSVQLKGTVDCNGKTLSPMSRVYYWGDFIGGGKVQLLTITHDRNFMDEENTSQFALIDLDSGRKLCETPLFQFGLDDGQYVCPFDYNGDGRAELCRTTSSGMEVYAYVGGKFKLQTTTSSINRTGFCSRSVLGDLNGDGLVDILTSPMESYRDEKYMDLPVWVPKTCPFCHKEDPVIYDGSDKCRFCNVSIKEKYITTKYPARCRMCGELLAKEDNGSEVELVCSIHGTTCQDKVCVSYVDNGNLWTAYCSTGKGFVKSEMRLTPLNRGDVFLLMDVDNDGCADLLRESGGSIHMYMNDRGGIDVSNTASTSVSESSVFLPANVCGLSSMSHFVTISDAMVECYNYTKDFLRLGLLTGMVDSYGNICSDTYSYLSSYGSGYRYDRTVGYSYPYVSARAPLPLLTLARKRTDSSSQFSSSVSYSYVNAVYHCNGLGFLGFERVRTRDNISGITSEETRDPLMQGVVTRVETPEGLTVNEYVCEAHENGKRNPVLTSSSSIDKLTGVKTVTEMEYDAYNNPTKVTTSYGTVGHTVKSVEYVSPFAPSQYTVGLPLKVSTETTRGGAKWVEGETVSYNPDGQPVTKITFANGVKTGETRWTYDSNGNVASEKSAPYNVAEFIGSVYTYSGDGRHLLSSTNIFGQTTTYSDYDKFGNARMESDYKKRTVRHAYDEWGNRVSTEYPDGTTDRVTRSWGGRGLYAILSEKTGTPSEKIHYDQLGRKIRVGVQRADGKWQNVDSEYDVQGRLSRVSKPFTGESAVLWNAYSYDSHNRRTAFTEASGKSTTWAYAGNSVTETKDGVATKRISDDAGILVSVEDPGGEIRYSVRPDGQVEKIVVNNSATTTFTYDAVGRKTAVDDPSLGHQNFSDVYAADGTCQKTFVDASGNRTVTRLDKYGRQTMVVRPEFTSGYEYDSDGNLAKVSSDNGTSVAFQYDGCGRLVSRVRTMDNISLKNTFTYNDGNLAELHTEGCIGGNVQIKTTQSYTYAYGHKVKTLLDNSTTVYEMLAENGLGLVTSAMSGTMRRQYGYDQYGNITSRKAGSIQDIVYAFDPNTGNLLSRTDNIRHKEETFAYDALNRLVRTPKGDVVYDKNGNILSMSGVGTMEYAHPSKPYAMTDFCRDAPASGTSGLSISYNSMQRPAGISSGATIASLDYDYTCERVRMTIGKRTKCYLDEYETTADGSHQILYLDGDAYTAPMACVKNGSSSMWQLVNICRDHLGSITHIADASGELICEYSYDAWGRMRNPATHEVYEYGNEPELYLDRGYTGHEYMPEFRLLNMNARLYDVETGRFLSPDPYVQMPDFTQSYNRYSYCINNPLRYVDPSGKYFGVDDVIVCIVGGIINVTVNLVTGNIHGVWHGVASFAVGAAAAECSIYGMGMASTLIVGVGNSVVNQGFENGFNNISMSQVLGDGIMAFITSGLGKYIGKYTEKPLTQFVESVTDNEMLQCVMSQSINESTSGFFIGTLFGLNENGNIWDAMNMGLKQAGIGLVTGSISGFEMGLHKMPFARSDTSSEVDGHVKPEKIVKDVMDSPLTPDGEGNNYVYIGTDAQGNVGYVGITNNPNRRFMEHKYSKSPKNELDFQVIKGTGKLSRIQSRIIEQTLINSYGMQKNGGMLYNKINSISKQKWSNYGIK